MTSSRPLLRVGSAKEEGPPRSAATREPGLILRSLGADVQADAETEGQVDALSAILVPLLTAAGVWLVPNRS